MTGMVSNGIMKPLTRRQVKKALDLVITLAILFLIIIWPRLGEVRYYLLLAVGLALLFIALIFAPFLILAPAFYVGIIILIVLLLYRGFSKGRKKKG